mgnify:CR=1 FL=1
MCAVELSWKCQFKASLEGLHSGNHGSLISHPPAAWVTKSIVSKGVPYVNPIKTKRVGSGEDKVRNPEILKWISKWRH